MSAIRRWLSGKKTYLTAVAALLGGVIAWAEGGIDDRELVVAVFVAIQTIWLRAAIAKAEVPNM